MAIENCILGLLFLFGSFQTIRSQIATACAGAPNGAFVRNSQSCRAYYYCSDGEAHPNECPENYVFEPVRQVCHLPSYVQCTGCSPYGIQHIPHPTDCTSYYLCVSGIRTLQKCRDNLIFDKSIGDCNAASAVQCIMDYTQICAEFGGYVKISDPNDCSQYFSCLYGVAYHQSCAPGLFFKPAIASCTFPEENDFCQGDGLVLSSDNNSEDPIVLVAHPPTDNNIYDPAESHTEHNSDLLIDAPSDTSAVESMDLSSETNSYESVDLPTDNHTDDLITLPTDDSSEGFSDNNADGLILPPDDYNSEGTIALPTDDNTDVIVQLSDQNSDEFIVLPTDNDSDLLHDIDNNYSNETY